MNPPMRVSVLGTGLMGAPIAQTLHQAGHSVIAWNRSPNKLTPLSEAGIATAESAAAAIAQAEITLTLLSDAAALEAVLFAEPAALANRTILQMGTIAPGESRDLAARIEAAGGEYFEAPVLGSIPEAKSGSLIVMVGASPAQFDRWGSLLTCLGPDPQRMGPVGSAAATKLAMNQLIGTLTAAFSISLALAAREGLDIEQFMGIVRQSALYAPTFDKKLSRMCDRNFANPNFPTKHLLKDMNLFALAAEAQGIDASVAASVSALAAKAVAQGLADQDYSALYSAVNPLPGA